ncbi:MAG: lipopolysaccharide biosynthesis protein, partial [Candidatus Helarchaeota archaeon]
PLFAIQPLKAWGPYIFSLINNPKKCKTTIANFSRYYWAAILFLAILISVFSREVLMIMAKSDYWSAWKVVFLLSISSVFFGMMNVTAYGFHIVKLTWVMSIIEISGSLLNLLFNYLLIPKYGMIGASVATSLSFLCILIGYFVFLEKVYPIPFKYFKFIFVFILSGIVYYTSTFIQFGIIQSILLKLLVVLLFPTILIVSGYFNKAELQKGKMLIFRAKRKISSMLSFQKA